MLSHHTHWIVHLNGDGAFVNVQIATNRIGRFDVVYVVLFEILVVVVVFQTVKHV
jgi:hypothetical protein